jgi:ferredoxin
MKHLIIDDTKCIGCGLCKQVCIRDNIEIIDGTAVDVESNCFDCGQCSTACPFNAITIKVYEGQEGRLEDYDPDNIPVSYEDMLQFYKQRRTCRWFKNEKISSDTIYKLLEGAYYSPNRQNIQDVEFVLVDEKMDEFINHVYSIIKAKEDEFFRIKQVGDYLADENRDPKRHPLLWEGQQLLLAFSENKTDAIIAMTRIELLAYSLGLGGFHSLFIGMAEQIDNDKLMEFFPEIDSNKHMYAAFVLGIPRVKYKRTRPHKEIKLTIK